MVVVENVQTAINSYWPLLLQPRNWQLFRICAQTLLQEFSTM